MKLHTKKYFRNYYGYVPGAYMVLTKYKYIKRIKKNKYKIINDLPHVLRFKALYLKMFRIPIYQFINTYIQDLIFELSDLINLNNNYERYDCECLNFTSIPILKRSDQRKTIIFVPLPYKSTVYGITRYIEKNIDFIIKCIDDELTIKKLKNLKIQIRNCRVSKHRLIS